MAGKQVPAGALRGGGGKRGRCRRVRRCGWHFVLGGWHGLVHANSFLISGERRISGARRGAPRLRGVAEHPPCLLPANPDAHVYLGGRHGGCSHSALVGPCGGCFRVCARLDEMEIQHGGEKKEGGEGRRGIAVEQSPTTVRGSRDPQIQTLSCTCACASLTQI